MTAASERGRRMMRRRDFLKAAGAAPLALLVGCQDKTSTRPEPSTSKPAAKEPCEPKPEKKTAAKKPGTCVLCYKCGQVKGSAKCCKPGAAKCPRCGLHAGSPGCCRLAGATAAVCLCTYCGQIKGSAKCCQPGAAKCPRCGLNAGSPGCCRIRKE